MQTERERVKIRLRAFLYASKKKKEERVLQLMAATKFIVNVGCVLMIFFSSSSLDIPGLFCIPF